MIRALVVSLLLFASTDAFGQIMLRSITPSSGPYSGGFHVTLRGENLRHLCPAPCPPENTFVLFGRNEVPIVSISDTEAVVIAPPHRPGSVDVLIGSRAAGAGVLLNRAFSYYSDVMSFPPGTLLLPVISTGDTPGANGSVWRTILSIWDPEEGAIQLDPTWLPGPGDPNPSRFASIEESDDLAVHLRVQDISRNGETYGTAIPIVRDIDLRIERLMLDRVPTDARFRVALRIYMVNGMYGTGFVAQPFRVRVFRAGTNELLLEDTADVRTPYGTDILNPRAPLYPAIHQNHDFIATHPELFAAEQVRIEIDPGTRASENPVPLYWAFVTVTHRETQHVTVIAPH